MLKSILLVSLGAGPGAWLRFRLINHFEPIVPAKHWATLAVNIGASFCLGLLVALNQLCLSNQLMLLLATGVLGSLSTFSTFVVELLVLLHKQAPAEALLLALASVVSGLLALELGLAIGGLQ